MFIRKICVVTGSRADYGHLYPLLRRLQKLKTYDLQIIATGMHLSSEFGSTINEIEKDGFRVDYRVEMPLSDDSSIGIARSVSIGIAGFAEAFTALAPDLVIVLGDRFEIFSAVCPAYFMKIPIAHFHGGEVTAGAFDEALRHSISKMASIHFTATENYRKRVIQLGEDPTTVHNVGAIGLDSFHDMQLFSKEELEVELGFKFAARNLLVAFHPETLATIPVTEQFQVVLKALLKLKDVFFIFTRTNADTDGSVINKMIDAFVEEHSNSSVAFISLGQKRFLSALRHVDGILGNSSSGIIEAPSMKTGTVNIGNRQLGRDRADTVIDCQYDPGEIVQAIEELFSPVYKARLENVINPYGSLNASEKVIDVLQVFDFQRNTLKKFHDVEFQI